MLDANVLKRDQMVLCTNGVALFAVLTFVVLRPWNTHNGFMTLAPIGRDFINFWVGGKLALSGNLDLLADWSGYNELIYQTFNRNPEGWFIFSYPPHAVLFLVPFGAIHHLAAVALWTILDLYFMARAVRLLSPDPRMVIVTLLSPASLVMVAFGQPIGAFAFLSIYILTRGRERPLVAGIFLALLTVKPQLAGVLGLFLLCTGYWRVIAHSIVPTVALLGVSVLVFGLKPWINFFSWTIPLHNKFIFYFIYDALLVTVSVYCGLRLMGLPGWVAGPVQAAFTLVVMGKAALVLRRRGPDARAVALVLFAVISALPYFNCYDLALFAPALSVAMFENSARDDRTFLPLAPAIALWVAPILAIPFGMYSLPIVHPVLAVVLIWALFRNDQTVAAVRIAPPAQATAEAAS